MLTRKELMKRWHDMKRLHVLNKDYTIMYVPIYGYDNQIEAYAPYGDAIKIWKEDYHNAKE